MSPNIIKTESFHNNLFRKTPIGQEKDPTRAYNTPIGRTTCSIDRGEASVEMYKVLKLRLDNKKSYEV